jgi:hypothetical protein
VPDDADRQAWWMITSDTSDAKLWRFMLHSYFGPLYFRTVMFIFLNEQHGRPLLELFIFVNIICTSYTALGTKGKKG